MKTVFPTALGCSGMFLVGQRRHPSAATAQQVGVVVLKRHYRLQGQRLVPAKDPVGIRVADSLLSDSHDGDSYLITDFESDMALYKPSVDLVVRGYYIDGDSCSASVKPPAGPEQEWFSRSGPAPQDTELGIPDLDARHHMFGWENRALQNRRLLGIDSDNTPPELEPIVDNLYFNGYRRRFQRQPFPSGTIASGSEIRISRTTNGATTALALTLGQEQVHADLFVADGSSPDQRRFWCRHRITAVRADTVVISPQASEAYVVWRGVWPYDLYPADRYRMLEVRLTEESV